MEVVSTTATTAAHRIGRKANARRTHLPASCVGLHPREHRPEHHDRRGHQRAAGPPERPRPAQDQPRRHQRRRGGDPRVRLSRCAVEVGQRGVGGEVEHPVVQARQRGEGDPGGEAGDRPGHVPSVVRLGAPVRSAAEHPPHQHGGSAGDEEDQPGEQAAQARHQHRVERQREGQQGAVAGQGDAERAHRHGLQRRAQPTQQAAARAGGRPQRVRGADAERRGPAHPPHVAERTR